VRGTALPWSSAELALARAIGTALIDIIVQVHAVRLLIANEHQLANSSAARRAAALYGQIRAFGGAPPA
jgi:chemotaxis family two-component system sensor kinase Cph1